jgi:hypothetical protein
MFVVVVCWFGILVLHRKNLENFECPLLCFLQWIKIIQNSAEIYCVCESSYEKVRLINILVADKLCNELFTSPVLFTTDTIYFCRILNDLDSLKVPETPTIAITWYPVNKCFIILNSIRDYDTMDKHRTCLPCLLLLSVDLGF